MTLLYLAVKHDGVLVIDVGAHIVEEPGRHLAEQVEEEASGLASIARGELEEGAGEAGSQRHKVDSKVVHPPAAMGILVSAPTCGSDSTTMACS